MANISYPQRFKQKLEQDQYINGIVNKTLFDFGDILEDNKLYFFEEYTDHGIRHIENVLAASDRIIDDHTFNDKLLPKDIGCLSLAVILHDLGMHLTLPGLTLLLEGGYDDVRVPEFDNLRWVELWEDYLKEAKKFSGKQLKSIFGNEHTVIRIPPISNPGDITNNDKKLIGEFIRRNHARLAHEIALKGFPAKQRMNVEFAAGLSLDLKNLSGLIARSHGLELRTSLDYLEKEHSTARANPFEVHAIFLMVILRIADYLQIQKNRTSEVLIKTKTFSSPVSQFEHDSHLSIDYITDKYQSDPERIYVRASPKTSKMYLKLQKLFKDIQYELDVSWAVLGEIYGKDCPRFKFRRITTNLSENGFAAKQSYVPEKISFDVVPDIIKLLVAPLYGSNPSYGVRELVQNSVDACREREFIHRDSISGNIIKEYEAVILVNIFKVDDNNAYFEIEDNGKGMTIEEIKNYFMKAGASYRKSITWQRKYVDIEGNAKVQKSGRFGIGVLAAFLLGDEIEVWTNSCEAKQGYHFKAHIDDDIVEVQKNKDVKIGTKIRISVNARTLIQLQENSSWYRWYTLSKPKIHYTFLGTMKLPYQHDPGIDDVLTNDWYSFSTTEYRKVLWSYIKTATPFKINCNGIGVGSALENIPMAIEVSKNFFFSIPNIVVFDFDAKLPLTLDRRDVDGILPFEDELFKEISKDIVSKMLLFEIKFDENGRLNLSHPALDNSLSPTQSFMHKYDFVNIKNVFLMHEGFGFDYHYFYSEIKTICIYQKVSQVKLEDYSEIMPRYLIDLYGPSSKSYNEFANIIRAAVQPLGRSVSNQNSTDFLIFNITALGQSSNYNTQNLPSHRYYNWQSYFSNDDKKVLEKLFIKSYKLSPNWYIYIKELDTRDKNYDARYKSILEENKAITNIDFLENRTGSVLVIAGISKTQKKFKSAIFDEVLSRYIGSFIPIPYELEIRKRIYFTAFSELAKYMKKYI